MKTWWVADCNDKDRVNKAVCLVFNVQCLLQEMPMRKLEHFIFRVTWLWRCLVYDLWIMKGKGVWCTYFLWRMFGWLFVAPIFLLEFPQISPLTLKFLMEVRWAEFGVLTHTDNIGLWKCPIIWLVAYGSLLIQLI